MPTEEKDSSVVIKLPLWQVVLLLVGLPALYIANSLMPWSIGLLQRHEHSFYFPFWSSIAILHWGSVALIVFLLKRVRGRLADIGLDVSPIKVAVIVGIPLIVGLVLTLMHETAASNHSPPSASSAVLPASLGERLFWIFMSLTAGFCEELIYRGFSIRMLQRHKVHTWIAVILATLAFFLMHGVSAIALPHFLTIYVAGLLFSVLFLWRRSLLPGICLHALIDVVNIGVP